MPSDYDLATPVVNLNGTSREGLLAPLVSALDALRRADEALALTCPNARDYQTQADTTFQIAAREHRARRAKIAEVISELEHIAESIA